MSVEKFTKERLKRSLLLPTLVLSYFLIVSFGIFSGVLLVDIAKTFQVSIGTASQGATVSHLVGLVLGLVMGALTLRFKHKSLFLTGIVLNSVGILGFYSSQNFASILISSIFIGLGVGMISIMVFSLIGELIPLERRGMAIGLVFSVSFIASAIGGPLFGSIAQVAGWRSPILWFLFPLSVICLLLGLILIPSTAHRQTSKPKSTYSEAFKQVLTNKSSAACLVGTTIAWIAATIPVYAVSFYRVAYLVSPSTGGTFAAISSVGGIFGGVIGGRFVNRLGRKKLTIAGFFASGALTILWTFVPDTSFSVAVWTFSVFFAALAFSAFFSLILEQVPSFKASMMSVNGTFQSAGQILGVIIGGLVLNIYLNNFHLLMTIFGSASVTVAAIILLFARDPGKNLPLSSSDA